MSDLIEGLERKNGRALAERVGEVSSNGTQRLLRRADWDVDGVHDCVVEHLSDPQGVVIGEETRLVKKCRRSAGMQRQYSCTAWRTENCQIDAFLAYAPRHQHTLIDRESYLPESWTTD